MGRRRLPVRKPVAYRSRAGKLALLAFLAFNAAMLGWLAYLLRYTSPHDAIEVAEHEARIGLLIIVWMLGAAGLGALALATRHTRLVKIERDESGRKIVKKD